MNQKRDAIAFAILAAVFYGISTPLSQQELPIGAFEIWQSAMEDAHGRLEHRVITVASYIDDEGKRGKWKDLQTVIRYRCLRTIDNKTSESTRYDISSADAPASQFAYWIRNHWSIENKLHWMLDVAFKEDNCKVRKDHSPQNHNVLRKMALTCLKKTPLCEKQASTARNLSRH